MKSIEDRIRAAAHAAADLVAENSAPPLDLAGELGPAGRSRPRRRDRSGRRLIWAVLTPVAAAAAVAAVIVASVAIGGDDHAARPAASGSLLQEVPRYYMQLVPGVGVPSRTGSQFAEVRNTVTGATLAVVRPPSDSAFVKVVGAADDRTFALVAQSLRPATSQGVQGENATDRLYLVRFNPSSHGVSVTEVRVPMTLYAAPWGPFPERPHVVYQVLTAIALSPGGTGLAVATASTGNDIPDPAPGLLRIYSVTGGPARTWQLATPRYPAGNPPNLYALSWGPAGSLAFNLSVYCDADASCPPGTPPPGVWVLNLQSRGTSLLTDSRFVVPYDSRYGSISDIVLTSDGAAIVGAMQRPTVRTSGSQMPGGGDFQEFAARTGKEIRELWSTEDGSHLEWSNASGSVLVVLAPPTRDGMNWILGAVSGNRIVRIPNTDRQLLRDGFTTDIAF